MDMGGLPKINETQAAGLNQLKKKIQLGPLFAAGKAVATKTADAKSTAVGAIEKARAEAYKEAMLDMLYADTILQQSAALSQEDPSMAPPAPAPVG